MSSGTPAARIMGPVTPRSSMSSSEMKPTPLVRRVQMGFESSRSSYSSTLLGNARMNLPDRVLPSARRLQRQPADADVAGHHALAGKHFENAQNVFALAEAVEEHAHRADIERVRAQPHQMAVQPRKLGHHHAHPLRARRNLDLQQLFHRQRVHQIVRKVGQIVDAVGQRDHLLPGLLLALLFDAGVQEADVGHGLDDGLAFQFEHDPQHAVRGGMLRPHVERHAPRRGRTWPGPPERPRWFAT